MSSSYNGSFEPCEDLDSQQIISTIIIVISSVIGIVLNLILIAVVLSTACHGSPSRQFQTVMILSISFSDLAYLICAPVHDLSTTFGHSIVGSIQMCRTFAFILILTQGVSSLSLLLLSFDRYRAILKPIQHRQWQQKRRYALATVFIWITSVIMTIPQLTISRIYVNSPCGDGLEIANCDHIMFDQFTKVYYTVQVVLFYVLPLCFITFCYSKIAYKLRQSPQFEVNESQAKATRQRCKLSVALIVISISFGICWFPLMFSKLTMQYHFEQVFTKFDLNKWAVFIQICPIFVYFNCSLDPIIIFTLSRQYRIAFRKPLRSWQKLSKTLSMQRKSTYVTETVVMDTVHTNYPEKRSLVIKMESLK
ncbi:neuropeptide Y receptor type 1-like [Antedon mediterranea]|uniref:neuropeptide Y receptor type 1-like n=1 Tax=Antedon mediterranea TaxID=105859 RepID=UPI003AF8BF4C